VKRVKTPKPVSICQECLQDFTHGDFSDGFCSDSCLEKYEKELMGEDGDDEEE